MPDPYDLTGDTRGSRRSPPATVPASAPPSVAWIVLVATAAGNVVASAGGASVAVHLLLGVLTAASVAVLAVQRLRRRAGR